MSLTKNDSHVSEALFQLMEQFKGQPDLAALLTSYITQIQDIEGVLFELIDERLLASAVGEQLDIIGRIVGEDRNGNTDDDYRILITARILINRSNGRIPEINDVLGLMASVVDPAISWSLEERPPACFYVEETTPGGGLFDPALTLAVLKSMKAAGVCVQFTYHAGDEEDAFRFASGDTPEASTTQGFGNEGQTTGGKFANAIA